MKKWILKAIVQKTISYLPYSNRINYIFQKYVTKGVNLSDDYFYDRLGHAQEHLVSFRKYANRTFPENSLEIGTGWYPVVPISFFLCGVQKIYSVDIVFLTSKERIKTTIGKFIEGNKLGKIKSYINYLPEKFIELEAIYNEIENLSLDEILSRINVEYLIGDARKLSLADNSIELVNSNNTFEHIYPEILLPILAEFKRVVKKSDGIMSHSIDMSDHFAHFDKSINIYNFLQFSDEQWKWIDNSIQPQSRLRYDDYKKMYAELAIPISEETFRAGNINQINQIKLDSKYMECSKESVAKSHCYFVSVM